MACGGLPAGGSSEMLLSLPGEPKALPAWYMALGLMSSPSTSSGSLLFSPCRGDARGGSWGVECRAGR